MFSGTRRGAGGRQARTGWWVDGRKELLALKFSACCLKVSMYENRCGSERRDREGHQMDTFFREGRWDMGTRVSKEDTLYIGDSTRVIACFPEYPPALSKLMPQVPTVSALLPASSREGDKDVEYDMRGNTLLSSSSSNQNCSSACPALPARVRKSESPEHTGKQPCLSPSPLPSLPHCQPLT